MREEAPPRFCLDIFINFWFDDVKIMLVSSNPPIIGSVLAERPVSAPGFNQGQSAGGRKVAFRYIFFET